MQLLCNLYGRLQADGIMASTSSPTSSPLRPHMDERGYLFVLPHLGLPDPAGEWHTVKAAVGRKRDIVDLVVNPASYQTPLRAEVAWDDMAVMPVTLRGCFWVLFLLKPTDPSDTAGPEFFSLKLKRGPASRNTIPQPTLPDATEWVFVPKSIFDEQMAAVGPTSSPSTQQALSHKASPTIGGGTAEHVRKWQAYDRKAKQDVTDVEAIHGDILDSDWRVPVLKQTLLEAAKRGDYSKATTEELTITIRLHPAPGGDFRSIDYAVRASDEPKNATVPEEMWKPLPPHATRPDGDRKFVNVRRVAVGKAAFSKEEWAAMRAAQQQQEASRIRATMLHDRAL